LLESSDIGMGKHRAPTPLELSRPASTPPCGKRMHEIYRCGSVLAEMLWNTVLVI
jgi:hypothetical protein